MPRPGRFPLCRGQHTPIVGSFRLSARAPNTVAVPWRLVSTPEPAADERDPVAHPLLARTEVLLVGTCVLAGSILRFTPSTPLWLDEALSVNIASARLGDIATMLRHDGHPPLYYYILHVWIALFGTSAFAVRSLSGLVGLATMAMLYVVARRLGGTRVARTSVAVLAVLPFGIRYSSEARMYELVSLLSLVGWWCIDWALFRPKERSGSVPRAALVALWLTAGALLLTHYWAIFFLAAVGIALVAGAWRADSTRRRAEFVQVIIAIVAGGVWFVPWLSAFAYQSAHTGTPWAPPSRPTRIVSESLIDWAGGIDPEAVLLLVALTLTAAVGLFGHVGARGNVEIGTIEPGWRRRALWVIGATLAIGGAASTASSSAFAGRYSSVVMPFFILLVGTGIAAFPRVAVRVSLLAMIAILGMGAVAIALVHDRTQAGATAAVLRAQAEPGDIVVACPDQLGPALVRLVHLNGVRVVRYPDLGDPHIVDWVDYKERIGSCRSRQQPIAFWPRQDRTRFGSRGVAVTGSSDRTATSWRRGWRRPDLARHPRCRPTR